MSQLKTTLLSVLALAAGSHPQLVAQVAGFEKVTTGVVATTPGESLGSAWGDLDGDGDLDLIVANGVASNANHQFRNDGGGTFTQITVGLLPNDPANSDDVCLFDIDNDDDLDVFVANRSGDNALYRNQGGLQGGAEGTFIKAFSEQLVSDGGDSRGCAVGDVDNDGDLDLFVANASGQNNLFYRNLGGLQGGTVGTFTHVLFIPIALDGGNSYAAAFEDIDGDGDLDLFVANGGGQDNFLYTNDGAGAFTKVTGVAPVNDGGDSHGCAFGDLDGDGDADLVVGNLLQNTNVYLNQGGVQGGSEGSFAKVMTGALVTTTSSTNDLALGDYDADGDLDLAIATCCASTNTIWNNTGSGGQFDLVATGPVSMDAGASNDVQFADQDGDGDLDLFFADSTSMGTSLNLQYVNNGPGAFTKVTSDPLATDVNKHFDATLGDDDGDGDVDVFFANTDNENNALYRNNGGAQGGTEGSFTRVLAGALVVDGGDTWGAEWGDADGDGDLDLVTADRLGSPNGNNGLYQNLGNLQGGAEGTYAKQAGNPVVTAGGTSRDVAWGDLDGDGDLDLVFANSNFEGNLVYRNQGGVQGGTEGTFLPANNAITTAAGENYGVAWGDRDQDGDLDLFIANRAGNNFLFTNAGGLQGGTIGAFNLDVSGPVVTDGGNSFSGAWGDKDDDGDLDLFVSNGDTVNFLYTNQGNDQGGVLGSFVRVVTGPVATDPAAARQAAWGDVDGDGDADLFVPNATGVDNALYVNNGAGVLSHGAGIVVHDGGNSRDAAFGDLDGDGDPDLVVSNQGEPAGYYRNDTPVKVAALENIGFGLAGVKGVPTLGANGSLNAGSPLIFLVVNAKNSALTGFFAGFSQINAPFKGGTLVPAPAILVSIPTDSTGFYTFSTTWPAGVPGGFKSWYQVWISDPAGVKGFAATNAIEGTTP